MYKELAQYILSLDAPDQNDNALFVVLVNKGFELTGLTDKDMRREFDISKPTLERWKSGVNAPHPAMRPHVFKHLKRLAVNKLCELIISA